MLMPVFFNKLAIFMIKISNLPKKGKIKKKQI